MARDDADKVGDPEVRGRGPAPLSFSQERMWFISRLYPDGVFYNVPVAYSLYGRLDPPSLEKALETVVRRHASLRTHIRETGGRPAQVVAEPDSVTIALELVDLRGAAEDERDAEALRFATRVAARPFDLQRGPLLRCSLLQLAETRYLFLLVMHHIVCDGWSMGVFFRELAVAYAAISSGSPPDLPELPVQYPDYAAWQRGRLRGEVLERHIRYWMEKLDGAPALLELPSDRPRPSVQSFTGARLAFAVPAALTARLKALSRHWGATLFMTLLAGFKVLLHRYSGEDDLVVGTPIANRGRPELEGLIGFFVNNLALRTDLSGDPSFETLVARVRETALEAYTHQELPFEQLVERLRPERNPSHQPIYQVMFALQNAPGDPFRLADLESRRAVVDIGTSLTDLVMTLEEADTGLIGALQYSADLFDRSTAEALVRHYLTLLEGVAATPDRRLSELPLIRDDEAGRLVAAGSAPPAAPEAYARGATIHSLFEERAAAHPNRTAVECGERRLTYGELRERAAALAARLRSLGVIPETLVAVSVERSTELITTLLAVLMAGGAYVPLDPEYPDQRLAWMLEDTGAPVVLTQSDSAARLVSLAGGSARVLVVNENTVDEGPGVTAGGPPRVTAGGPPRVTAGGPPRVTAGRSPASAAGVAGSENLAYVLYTSGSTGRPKGVAVPHRAVIRLVRGSNFASLGEDEVFLQFAPVSFDASTLEIWGPLLNGGRLVAVPPGAWSLEEIAKVIQSAGVTTCWLTAGLFNLMVDEQAFRLTGLRQLLFGGEVASATHVGLARRLLPGCRLINGYGPTENTTFTACHTVGDSIADGRSVPIGRQVSGTTVYILDRHLKLVPDGLPGELHTGGAGLARGYHDRPELTAERFIPDPFGPHPGGRLYRTGDLCRRMPDGHLEFIGRRDNQVKVRGFRIEPGEIEAVLLGYPGVREAAVAVREDVPGERYLAAYVAPDGLPTADIRAYLTSRLPSYMVPAHLTLLRSLPTTASGKVDRGSLPPPSTGVEGGGVSDDPLTPLESAVAAVWVKLMGLERVGRHDNFFELGGHSLMAMRVVSHLRERLGIELPLRVIFDSPTVAGLASALEGLQPTGASAER